MNKVNYIAPVCISVEIKNRVGSPRGFNFNITRSDGKEYFLFGNGYKYNNGLLNIKLSKERLPVILEVKEEFLKIN